MESIENGLFNCVNEVKMLSEIRSVAYYAAKNKLRKEHLFWLEDIVQDVVVKVYKNLDKYDMDRASLKTWVNRIAINECIDFAKRSVVRNTVRMEVLGGTFESTDDSDYWSRKEMFVAMENAMLRLSEQDAQLLTLKYYEGKSSREITAITGIPENQVPVCMQRARKRLQQLEWSGSMAA